MIVKWFWHNPHLVLTSAAVSWAGHAVAARLAVGEVSPLLLMQLRWLFCFLILLAIFWKEMAAHWPAVKQRWRYVGLMGGLGLAGFTSLFSLGAQHTTAVNLGDLLMIAACFCYAFYVLHLGKRLDMPPIIMVAYFSFSALLSLTFFSIGEYAAGQLLVPSVTGIAIILYCAIFPSILSQTFFMRGVELIGANRAGLYVNLVPVFAAFMAIGLLSERLHGYHVVALLMVLAGIALAEKHKVSTPAG